MIKKNMIHRNLSRLYLPVFVIFTKYIYKHFQLII